MKVNQQLVQINRNFIICFIVSASFSAIIAQSLAEYEYQITTTVTVGTGYIIYFGIFSSLFYFDNKRRYKQMTSSLIRKEILSMISSFGLGEIIYLVIRWPSLYYFLEFGIEAYMASLISEIISTVVYMITVSVFLRKMKTF
jgi:hypothetical protein